MLKIVAKFERDHPIRGRQMQAGWVKIVYFRRKTHYNSKTVQDRRIVSIKVENRKSCTLSSGYVSDDIWWPITPKTTPIFAFFVAFHIFVVSKHRDYLPPWLSGLAISELQCSESLAGLFGRAWIHLPLIPPAGMVGQVQRVRLCPLKTVTGYHTQTVLGRLGVVRAAGVDNRCEGAWHVGTWQRNQPAYAGFYKYTAQAPGLAGKKHTWLGLG